VCVWENRDFAIVLGRLQKMVRNLAKLSVTEVPK
jgi:hypothetical protein